MDRKTDKIYRRPTQSPGKPEQKKRDEKKRKRNNIINFRVTPMEKQLINARIHLTGLTKTEFFLQSCLYQKILVKGNVRTFAAIRATMDLLDERLNEITNAEELDVILLEEIQTIREILAAAPAKRIDE